MAKSKNKRKQRRLREISKNYKKAKKRSNTKKEKSTHVQEDVTVIKQEKDFFEKLPLNTIKKDLIKTGIFAVFSFGLIFVIQGTGFDLEQLTLLLKSFAASF